MADIRAISSIRQHPVAVGPAEGAVMDNARVIRKESGEYLLLTSGALALRARRAAGCLLDPEENDTVLLARNLQSGTYILTVLEKASAGGTLLLDGDTTLESTGKLTLSGNSVDIDANGEGIGVKGGVAELSLAALTLSAGITKLTTGRLSLAASVFDTVAERVTQRVRDCFRWVSGIDSTRASQVHVNVEKRMDMTAGNMAIVAEGEVKVDGEKIRLG